MKIDRIDASILDSVWSNPSHGISRFRLRTRVTVSKGGDLVEPDFFRHAQDFPFVTSRSLRDSRWVATRDFRLFGSYRLCRVEDDENDECDHEGAVDDQDNKRESGEKNFHRRLNSEGFGIFSCIERKTSRKFQRRESLPKFAR